MKLTILYDNTSARSELENDWGFSALIEVNDRIILFDTGADGDILLSNMKKLGINPERVTDVFISHAHYDHTGGLKSFLEANNDVTVWTPYSYSVDEEGVKVIRVKEMKRLYEDVHSTGELQNVEQSLCVKTKKGIILITGCSHPGIKRIIQKASKLGKVYGVIGGLHGAHPESLKGLKLIIGTHCTQRKNEMKKLYSDEFTTGGVGKVVKI